MKTKPIQFWDIEIPKMDREQLETELRVQKWLYRMVQKAHSKLVVIDRRTDKVSWIRFNKIEFCEIYMKQLEGIIAELKYYIPLRPYPDDYDKVKANAKKRKAVAWEQHKAWEKKDNALHQEKVRIGREGINLQWDKDKFLLVARDRGYRTEEAVVNVVAEELATNYTKAVMMVEGGRFTWGQVLVLGAKFEMTPKEFCDIFMAGYFVDQFGEYRASDANIDKAYLSRIGKYLPEWGKSANDGSQTEENADEDKSPDKE